jgi:antitoxin MazE
MTAVLQKWGNSSGIRIPKQVLVDLNIKVNDKLLITSVNDEIVIKKEKKHKTLEERLTEFYKKPISKIKKLKVEEIDTGDNVGDEIW